MKNSKTSPTKIAERSFNFKQIKITCIGVGSKFGLSRQLFFTVFEPTRRHRGDCSGKTFLGVVIVFIFKHGGPLQAIAIL